MTVVPPQDRDRDRARAGGTSSPAARALAARCAPRINELARRAARTAYGEGPGDERAAEMAATARQVLRILLSRAPDARGRAGDHLPFRDRAASRAEEGVALRHVLRGLALGVQVLWQALRECAQPGDDAALVELAGLLLGAHDGIVDAATESYVEEQAALAAAELRERRRALLRGLLDGSPPADAGSLAAAGLDRGGLVLCLRICWTKPPGAALDIRRRRRGIQAALDHAFGADVLTLFDDDGGYAVVPCSAGQDRPPEPPEDLAETLRRACGGRVRVGAVPVGSPGGIAEAARTAAEIVRVARAGGRPVGVHGLHDVLLEFHLSRRDESSGAIAALLEPIGARPELVETLRLYLESSQDRRGTARQLGLHPNTVDNRLARIAELTGLDLASPRGIALALAALLLRGDP